MIIRITIMQNIYIIWCCRINKGDYVKSCVEHHFVRAQRRTCTHALRIYMAPECRQYFLVLNYLSSPILPNLNPNWEFHLFNSFFYCSSTRYLYARHWPTYMRVWGRTTGVSASPASLFFCMTKAPPAHEPCLESHTSWPNVDRALRSGKTPSIIYRTIVSPVQLSIQCVYHQVRSMLFAGLVFNKLEMTSNLPLHLISV